jgi:ferrous-iron efflux pump FieF
MTSAGSAPKSMLAGTSLNKSAAFASITMAASLMVIKAWAAWATGSTAMLGSLADTGLDLISSIATLAGVWIAGQPADRNHRFGHGKAEALSAMFQAVLIAFSALGLGVHAVGQFFAQQRTQSADSGILVSGIAIAATLVLLAWQRHVIRRTGSIAIATDHIHYQADLLINVAVILALMLDQFAGFAHADALFGLGFAGWLGWGAWQASQQAVIQLMDREWPLEKKAHFIEVLGRHPELRGVHDLRTRTSGNRDFVQFHVWIDGNMSVRSAHRVMDELEAKIAAEFPDVEVLIHPDPDGHLDERGMATSDELAAGTAP